MTEKGSEFEIGPLRESDKEDIMEIAKHTWDGHDYLVYSFPKWIADPNSHTAAIRIKNKVVSVANLRVIDDGQTGWMEGLRVHHEYRGKGLASVMTRYIVKTAVDLGVKRLRYTTASDNVQSLHLASAVGMSIKFEMGGLWQEDMNTITWRYRNMPIKQVAPEEIPTEIYESDLIPYDILVHDWKAYDISPKILKVLSDSSSFWIQELNGEIAAFSIGGERYEGDTRYWTATIYAKDDTSFLDHLSHHLEIASEDYGGFFAAYPIRFMSLVSTLKWANTNEDPFGEDTRMVLLERVL